MTSGIDTVVLPVNAQFPESSVISRAAEVISLGGLVAFPTETVYGLGADALNPAAVAKIFESKQRPASDPLIVHIADIDELAPLVAYMPEALPELASRFWPGPLTLVLPRSAIVPDAVTAGGDTVAVRMPSHPVACALIQAAGTPIAAPSANRFGHVSPTSAAHVYADLQGSVDLILDGGSTPVGIESTVLSLVDTPLILRPGGLNREALSSILGPLDVFKRMLDDDELAPAPGTLLKHYAPHAQLTLYSGDDHQAVLDAMRDAITALSIQDARVGVLVASEDITWFSALNVVVQALGDAQDLEHIARTLFAAMRRLEDHNVTHILTYDFGTEGLGLAIRDRLVRASAGRVIEVNKKGS